MTDDKAPRAIDSELVAELRRRAGFGPSVLRMDPWVIAAEQKKARARAPLQPDSEIGAAALDRYMAV